MKENRPENTLTHWLINEGGKVIMLSFPNRRIKLKCASLELAGSYIFFTFLFFTLDLEEKENKSEADKSAERSGSEYLNMPIFL